MSWHMRSSGTFAADGMGMVDRLLLIAAAVAAVAACAPISTSATPAAQVKAADFETAISRLEADSPLSPEVLNIRLDYADFLSDAAGGDCQQRLTTAQSQLDVVAA